MKKESETEDLAVLFIKSTGVYIRDRRLNNPIHASVLGRKNSFYRKRATKGPML